MDQTREARTAHKKKIGAVGAMGWSADQARGPHRLNFDTWRLLIGPLAQFGESHPVAPCYKYKGEGVEIRTQTHHHTSSSLLLTLHSF